MNDSKDSMLRLYHIHDACQRVALFLEGYDFDMFCRDQKTQSAVTNQIKIIGEAARNMQSEIRDTVKDVAWEDVIGMRNKLVHDYFEIELSVVWETATRDVPDLLAKIQKVLSL